MTSLDSTAVHDGVPAPASADTPSLIRGASFAASGALEFFQVLEVVAGFAAGHLGAARVRRRRPAADPEWVRTEIALVSELIAWYGQGQSFDIPPVPDLSPVLHRLRLTGSVLEGGELLAVRETLAAARTVATELRRIEPEAPLIGSRSMPLPGRDLDKRLAQSLDDKGEVVDSASPALLRARRSVLEARTRLVRKLEAIARGGQPGEGSPEVTLRNGRYVIPVRRDARGRPEGIVHDESASGETLFLEPSAAIELGNALRSAILEAEREVLRVLRDLTELLRPHAEILAESHAGCVELDDLNARARYAHAVKGHGPAVRDPGQGLCLVQARHPLLLARGVETVPFDLELGEGDRTLLISGPNAGGKTVLLKTVGLAAALTQSGIVPPLGPGSALPVFESIGADIGDHQSIAADLSTFTAHLAVLRELLREAGPATLVLVDEIGSGTDPAEGGALAAAALLALTGRRALTIATTHLGSLKALATQHEGIINGSLQFDPDRLAPTFRFLKGPPGRSYGIAIARRLGIPGEVLSAAEARVPDAERSLDALLEAAERRERALAADQAELTVRLSELERARVRTAETLADLTAREAAVAARERQAEQQARREARRVMMAARTEVDAALHAAQSAASEDAATETRRRLEEAIRREGDAVRELEREADPAGAAPPLSEGQWVRLRSGGLGRVMEIREDGKVVVVAGSVKLVVSSSELRAAESPGGSAGQPGSFEPLPRSSRAQLSWPVALRTTLLAEVDLRGMRAEEAEASTLSALDAAVLDDLPYLRIIHGMGTGALREVVRRILAQDRRVTRFAAAPANQGGVGVTIAEFAP